SYLSMCAIFFLYPHLERWHPAAGNRRNITVRMWSAMALSLSCQIFTAPLVYATFGTLPLHFLLANLIALPLTELLINLAVPALLLPGGSLPCRLLCRACDCLASSLEESMRIVATM
ncbi:MAG: ComEC/Rec2 family competence protein, partial [Bacteroidales bacterium]|nr:ComEC/Rec2 family competence protein [Candidatus Cryptobacteroides aphodequi]